MTPPILFLIFNRPDLTQISFEQIRKAKPSRLFVAADGPRSDRDGETQLCENARRIVERVDWPCELTTLFRDQNLGCRRAISEAISWFFEHVEEGIILEDDCVADETFFPFCAEMLERYRADSRVMCITGNNFQRGQRRDEASYYFSSHNHIWGWATWKRAWEFYDSEISLWTESRVDSFRKLKTMINRKALSYWSCRFDEVIRGQVDTWDYQWAFTCWVNGGLTVTPKSNLVSNYGFDTRATHTLDDNSPLSKLSIEQLEFPLKHSHSVIRDKKADSRVDELVFGIRKFSFHVFLQRVKNKLCKTVCRSVNLLSGKTV